MAKAKKIVKTEIGTAGEPHVYQDLESTNEMPTLKSVGYARVAPGSRDYVSYVITSKGTEVVSVEVSEPNLKAIASDEAKINFVTLFEDQDQTLDEDLKHLAEESKK